MSLQEILSYPHYTEQRFEKLGHHGMQSFRCGMGLWGWGRRGGAILLRLRSRAKFNANSQVPFEFVRRKGTASFTYAGARRDCAVHTLGVLRRRQHFRHGRIVLSSLGVFVE